MIIDPNDLSEFDDTPDENLLGLSYRDLLALQIFPFAQTSPLKIRKHIPVEVLDKLPFFRLCEDLLTIVARVELTFDYLLDWTEADVPVLKEILHIRRPTC